MAGIGEDLDAPFLAGALAPSTPGKTRVRLQLMHGSGDAASSACETLLNPTNYEVAVALEELCGRFFATRKEPMMIDSAAAGQRRMEKDGEGEEEYDERVIWA